MGTRAWAAMVAAVVLVVGVAAVAASLESRRDTQGRDRVPAPVDVVGAPPPGFRWVGIGRAVIAVPDSWATNRLYCGTPLADTVIIDQGAVCLAYRPQPPRTSAVHVREPYQGEDFSAYDEVRVAGERALRGPVDCHRQPSEVVLCRQSVVLPDLGAVFDATTTRDRERLGEILGRISPLPAGQVAVPGFQMLFLDHQEASAAAYVRVLERAGLRAVVRTAQHGDLDPGFVLDAAPAPGSVVKEGATVTVTVTE